MQQVFYWDTILTFQNCQEIDADVSHVLELIKKGLYREVNLKQLKGAQGRLLRAKINKKDRIIFSETTYHGKPCLLVLGIMRNHRYDRLAYLHKSYVNKYIKDIDLATLELFIHHDSFAADVALDEQIILTTEEENSHSRISWRACLDKDKYPIALTEEQQELITCSLPAFIQGLAGTGKTCSGFARMIEAYVLEANNQELEDHCTKASMSASSSPSSFYQKNIAYVAPDNQHQLVQTIEQTWLETISSLPRTENIVAHFSTYTDLLLHAEIIEKSQIVDKRYFQQWIERHQIINPLLRGFNRDLMIHECRVISIYQKEEEYTSSFLFTQPQERKSFFSIFKQYTDSLSQNNLIDLEFMIPKNLRQKIFDFLLIDESQNLSPAQLETLRRLSGDNIMFSYDLRQQHDDLHPHLEATYQRMITEKAQPFKMTLTKTHRCKGDVAHFANKVQDLSDFIGGKSASRLSSLRLTDINQTKDIEGLIHYYSPVEFITQNPQSNFGPDNLDWAVFTPAEYIEEAKSLFNTQMIFEARHIGGLEFDYVFGYKIFDHKLLKKINKLIPQSNIVRESKFLKVGLSDQEITQAQNILNQIYTGITRSEDCFCLVQEKHPVKNILDWTLPAKEICSTQTEALPAQLFGKNYNEESSKEKYIKIIKQLINNNHPDQIETAKNLFNKKLKDELGISFEFWLSSQKELSQPRKKLSKIFLMNEAELSNNQESINNSLITNENPISSEEATLSSKLSKSQKKRAKEKAKRISSSPSTTQEIDLSFSWLAEKIKFFDNILLSKFNINDLSSSIKTSLHLGYLLDENIERSPNFKQTILHYLNENPEQLELLLSFISDKLKKGFNYFELIGLYFTKFNKDIYAASETIDLLGKIIIPLWLNQNNNIEKEKIELSIIGLQFLTAMIMLKKQPIDSSCISFLKNDFSAKSSFLDASINPIIIQFICSMTKQTPLTYQNINNIYEFIDSFEKNEEMTDLNNSALSLFEEITKNASSFLPFLDKLTRGVSFNVPLLLKKIALIKTVDVPFLRCLRSSLPQDFCNDEFMQTSWLNGFFVYYIKFVHSNPDLIPMMLGNKFCITRIFSESLSIYNFNSLSSLFKDEKLFFYYPTESEEHSFLRSALLEHPSAPLLATLYQSSIQRLKNQKKLNGSILKITNELSSFKKVNLEKSLSSEFRNDELSFKDNIFSYPLQSIMPCSLYSINLENEVSFILLMIEMNHIEDFKEHLRTKPINIINACYSGTAEIEQSMLTLIQYLSFTGNTLFLQAIDEILFDKNPDGFLTFLKATTIHGFSSVILAILKKHDETAYYLIKRGCDLPDRPISTRIFQEFKTTKPMVLLDCALFLNLLETSKALLEKGASSCYFESSEISFTEKFENQETAICHDNFNFLKKYRLMKESGIISIEESMDIDQILEKSLSITETNIVEMAVSLITNSRPSHSDFITFLQINNILKKSIRVLNQLKHIRNESPEEMTLYLIEACNRTICESLIKKILTACNHKLLGINTEQYKFRLIDIYASIKSNYPELLVHNSHAFINMCEEAHRTHFKIQDENESRVILFGYNQDSTDGNKKSLSK